jgi:hypothetical protein
MTSLRFAPLALVFVAAVAPRPASAANISLTVPPGVTMVRGVLACSSVGLGPGFCKSATFQEMAKANNMAIALITGENAFGDYANRCTGGEFKALLATLADAGMKANHPEIANAPIVGCGHSHGGDYWNYFNACFPERMALVFDKSSGGVTYQGAALKTPMVWEIGTEDLQDHIGPRHFRGQMFAYRIKGMVMSLVLGPGETHGGWKPESEKMVAALIDAIFKLRVPEDADPSKGPVKLNVIDESSERYWLGDIYTKEFAPYATSPDKDKLYNTSFLPNEAIANMWKGEGAPLPAAIKVETNGTCSGCYGHPNGEPDGAPVPGGPSATPPPTGGSVADAGAPAPAGDDASATPPPSGSGGSAPPPVTTPPPAMAVDAAVAPPTSAPAPPVRPRPVTGGCSFGGGAGGSSGALLLLALLGLRRRRR